MHLTGGLFKGRSVITPKGYNVDVRPTLSKVREGVFNILSSYYGNISGLSFLDMFTGSGIIALEAYSRGFKNVFAFESSSKTYYLAKKTFSTFEADINLIKGDALKVISKLENFDVIYIDPPWNYDYEPIILCAFEKLNKDGIIIIEYDKKDSKNTCLSNDFTPFKEKTYGRTKIDFYKKSAF